jgi:hypothetical protein
VTEAPLEKVLRLSAQQASLKASPKKQRFGTPYRVAWANVNVGDVLMFGNQVWKIVAPTAHPGHKMPALSAAPPDGGTAPSSSGAQPGKPAASSSSSQSPAGATSLAVYTHCLQSLASPGKYEELTLPDNFVVRAVPLLP